MSETLALAPHPGRDPTLWIAIATETPYLTFFLATTVPGRRIRKCCTNHTMTISGSCFQKRQCSGSIYHSLEICRLIKPSTFENQLLVPKSRSVSASGSFVIAQNFTVAVLERLPRTGYLPAQDAITVAVV